MQQESTTTTQHISATFCLSHSSSTRQSVRQPKTACFVQHSCSDVKKKQCLAGRREGLTAHIQTEIKREVSGVLQMPTKSNCKPIATQPRHKAGYPPHAVNPYLPSCHGSPAWHICRQAARSGGSVRNPRRSVQRAIQHQQLVQQRKPKVTA